MSLYMPPPEGYVVFDMGRWMRFLVVTRLKPEEWAERFNMTPHSHLFDRGIERITSQRPREISVEIAPGVKARKVFVVVQEPTKKKPKIVEPRWCVDVNETRAKGGLFDTKESLESAIGRKLPEVLN